MKFCNGCKRERDESKFYIDRRENGTLILRSPCKECTAENVKRRKREGVKDRAVRISLTDPAAVWLTKKI